MVTVQTLGRALIDAGTSRVMPTSVRKFALLLYLSAEPGRRVARSVLRDLIFPEQTEKNARHSLREMVYQLRQSGVVVDSDPDGIAISRTAIRVDYVEILARGRFEADEFRAIEGGFLPGYAPAHSEAFSEWFEGYHARTSFNLCKGLLSEVSRGRAVGDWTTTERAARACLALDPANEEGTLALAEMLALGGAKTQAVKLLDRYVADLGSGSRELKIAPAIVKRRINDQVSRTSSTQVFSAFVGRSNEMLQLRSELDLAKDEQTRCAVLFGEPGIGKSRILTEFCSVAELAGAVSATAAMQSNDAHRPFGAFADLLPELLSMPGALGCAPESLRCLDRLTKALPTDSTDVELRIEGEALCDAVTTAIIDLVDAIAGEQAVVVAIEDVHWIDDMSRRVLGSLVSTGRHRRLLTLLTTRQLNGTEFLRGTNEALTTINVRRLSNDAVRDMTVSLAERGNIAVDGAMQEWLQITSEGNPLFLESLFAHYASTNERFAISPTLAALLDRRIDMLSREAISVLRICSMLGKHATDEMICRAMDLPGFTLVRAVAELEESGLIKADGPWVRPSHALVADVAKRKSGPIERRLEHRCVAVALETLLTPEYPAAVVWDCAEHWIRAQDSDRALRAVANCARYALEIGRPRDAARMFSRALTLDLSRDERLGVARQMVLAADAAGESDLVSDGVQILRTQGETEDHDDIEFAEIRARARALKDAPLEEARLLLRCARAASADPTHRVAAAMWILKSTDIHGQFMFAGDAIEAIPDSVLSAASRQERLEFVLVRACVLDDCDAVANAASELLKLSLGEPASATRCSTQFNAAIGLWRAGRAEQALEAATMSYATSQESGSLRLGLNSVAMLVDLCFELGEDNAALMWIDRAIESIEALPDLADHFTLATVRIAVSIALGRSAEARTLFVDAQSRGVFKGGRVRERWNTVFEFRLNQVESRGIMPDDEIQRVARDIDGAQPMSGIFDYEVATACEALLLGGRAADARHFCDRFLRSQQRWRGQAPTCRSIREINDAINQAIEAGHSSVVI